jgi:hypothetical protein
MKKIFFILPFLSFVVCTANAQAPADISKKFFELYGAKPTDAIDYIFSGVKVTKQISDDITAIKKNLKVTIDNGGTYNGYELITEKNVNGSLKLMSYLVKYDAQPVRFIFIFYKPATNWKIYTFQFNTNLDDELTSAAAVDQLKENRE